MMRLKFGTPDISGAELSTKSGRGDLRHGQFRCWASTTEAVLAGVTRSTTRPPHRRRPSPLERPWWATHADAKPSGRFPDQGGPTPLGGRAQPGADVRGVGDGGEIGGLAAGDAAMERRQLRHRL